MQFIVERIDRIVSDLQKLIYPYAERFDGWRIRSVPARPWEPGTTVPLVGDGSGRFVPAAELVGTAGTFSGVDAEDGGEWRDFGRDESWGGKRQRFTFEVEVTVPDEADGRPLYLLFSTGRDEGWDAVNPQFACFVDGELCQGMDVNHRDLVVAREAVAGDKHRIRLESYTADREELMMFITRLAVRDEDVEALYYDLAVPLGVARLLPESSDERREILLTLNDAINRIDLRRPGSEAFLESVRETRDWFRSTFYEARCNPDKAPTVYAVGHTHIDIAWLWTLDITADKTVRSFATMLELMRQYPEFIFMSSQPQLYRFIERFAPQLLPEIEARVAEGRWEPEGAMFVEPDCNLASGEALVRQVTTGIAYFEERFGRRPRILWLPDVFGYSAALPQILRGAGIPYFMTTKISWNETNQLPMDTFTWEGIDGSTVLTHFSPSREYIQPCGKPAWFTTYNAELGPSHVLGAWQRYQQKDLNDFVLMTYGYGDGGGGTTREMLENARRLSQGIPGAPRVKLSSSLDFFHDLAEAVDTNPRLPRWTGELYLEYHRGTYTSMARNKRSNRRGEYALQNLEFVSTLAALECGAPWPADVLAEGWEILLRNQFHDILPGSSIHEVYVDSKKEYERLDQITSEAIAAQLGELAAQRGLGQDEILVLNPADVDGPALVTVPAELGEVSELRDTRTDEVLPLQRLATGEQVFAAELGGLGTARIAATRGSAPDAAGAAAETVDADGFVLEDAVYCLRFAANGEIDSIVDKRIGRELLREGQRGNRLVVYEDRPHNHEAWDINDYYVEKSWPVDGLASFRLVEDGPLLRSVEIRRDCLDSTLVQRVRLNAAHGQIDFDTEVDWKNHNLRSRPSSRWPSTATRRPSRSSTARSSAPSCATRAGTSRASRSSCTSGSTSRSTATASASSTTASTAATSSRARSA